LFGVFFDVPPDGFDDFDDLVNKIEDTNKLSYGFGEMGGLAVGLGVDALENDKSVKSFKDKVKKLLGSMAEGKSLRWIQECYHDG